MIVLTGPNVAITLAPDDIGRYLATQYTPHTSQGFITFRNLIFEIISTLSGEDKKIIRTKHVTLELSVLVRLLAAQFISLLINLVNKFRTKILFLLKVSRQMRVTCGSWN